MNSIIIGVIALGAALPTAWLFLRESRRRRGILQLVESVSLCRQRLGLPAGRARGDEQVLEAAGRALQLAAERLAEADREASARGAFLRDLDSRLQSLARLLRDRMSGLHEGLAELAEMSESVNRHSGHLSMSASEIITLVSDSSRASSREASSLERTRMSVEWVGGSGEEIQRRILRQREGRGLVTEALARGARSLRQLRLERESGARREGRDGSASSGALPREARTRARELGGICAEIAREAGLVLPSLLQAQAGFDEMSRRAEEARAIAEFMTNVAGETNLISLNASIVAASAGGEGRAFAVVADEIRELSERMSSSSREIAALLESQVETARAATAAFHAGTGQAEALVGRARRTAGGLEELLRGLAESAPAESEGTPGEAAAAQLAAAESALDEAAQRFGIMAADTDAIMQPAKEIVARTEDVAREILQQSECSAELVGRYSRIHDLAAPLQRHTEQLQQQGRHSQATLLRLEKLIEDAGALADRLESAPAPEGSQTEVPAGKQQTPPQPRGRAGREDLLVAAELEAVTTAADSAI